MTLVVGGLSPHPPLLIPSIGGPQLERVRTTQDALRKLAREVSAARPDRLVLVTPHGPQAEHAVTALGPERLRGDLGRFGAPQVIQEVQVDRELTETIRQESKLHGVPVRVLDHGTLDHGLMVPLYYLMEAGLGVPVVVLSAGGPSFRSHYGLGEALGRALSGRSDRTALVVSGDLSHRLLETGPYGFDSMGPEFDRRIVEGLEPLDRQGLCAIPPEVVRRAGVCGYKPLAVLLGALPAEVESRVLSYEGPFGVGYAVAWLAPAPSLSVPAGGETLAPPSGTRKRVPAGGETPRGRGQVLLELARRAVECHVRGEMVAASEVPGWLALPAGSFVSLKKSGELRGCIGTVSPTCQDLASELIRNAIGACSRDPRFPPVRVDELPFLIYSVYVLAPPVPVDGPHELDPIRYGVVVRCGRKTGVLLPGLAQITSADRQVEVALRKAGIRPHENYELLRFEVEMYLEGEG